MIQERRGAPVQDLRSIARVLVTKVPSDSERAELAPILTHDLRNAENTALLALACRRAGGQMWDRFRAAQTEIMGRRDLPGELLVMVNQLGKPALKVVAKE
jgi:hypothetical protein